MADLSVKSLGLESPFVVAASPTTQGVANTLRTAAS